MNASGKGDFGTYGGNQYRDGKEEEGEEGTVDAVGNDETWGLSMMAGEPPITLELTYKPPRRKLLHHCTAVRPSNYWKSGRYRRWGTSSPR